MSYCKNCGTNIGNDKFCTNCGQSNSCISENNTTSTSEISSASLPTNDKPKIFSLSFILISVLSVIGILSLLFDHYFKYSSLSVYGISSSQFYVSANYFSLSDSIIPGILAIILIFTPTILYLINIKLSKRVLYWISLGCEGFGLLYVLFSSLIMSEDFQIFNVGDTVYGMSYGYSRIFTKFEFLFFLAIFVFVIMIVVTIFDALNKPLIKITKKS